MKNHDWNAFPNVWFAFSAASVKHGVLTYKGQWHETSIKSFSMKINKNMPKITVILLKGWQILFGTETGNTASIYKSRCHRKKQQDFFIFSFPTSSPLLLWLSLPQENDEHLQEENSSTAKAVQYVSSFRLLIACSGGISNMNSHLQGLKSSIYF